MSAQAQIPVLLLKTKSSPTDSYQDHFDASGKYSPVFVPVLEHRFVDEALTTLTDLVAQGALCPNAPSARYGGIIFTSQRAVEAFASVVETLRSSKGPGTSFLLPAELPLYVVGPATARGLRSLDLACSILGEETGNGDALAEYILRDYNARLTLATIPSATPKRTLLFLVGEQRRDVIPKALQAVTLPSEARIAVEEVIVYETVEMASFPTDLESAMLWARTLNPQRQWIAIFSPTGCTAVLERLDRDAVKSQDTATGAYGESRTRKTLIVTIGPTTKAFLQSKFQFEPDACAKQPSVEGLLAAMEEVTKRC